MNDTYTENKILSILNPIFNQNNVTIVCIGSMRILKDSVGPRIGSKLKKLGFDVIGTEENPVHMTNFYERIKRINFNNFILAIDAASTDYIYRFGYIELTDRGCILGSGIKSEIDDLPIIGDFTIKLINNQGYTDLFEERDNGYVYSFVEYISNIFSKVSVIDYENKSLCR